MHPPHLSIRLKTHSASRVGGHYKALLGDLPARLAAALRPDFFRAATATPGASQYGAHVGVKRYRLTVAAGSVALGLLFVAGTSASGSTSHQSGIPPRVRARLLQIAKREAATNRDQHPYDVQAVRTTWGKWNRLNGGGSYELPPGEPVYVIAMRGHFHCGRCSSPPPSPGGRSSRFRGGVITLVCITATLECPSFGFNVPYPHLRALGTPVRLDARRRR